MMRSTSLLAFLGRIEMGHVASSSNVIFKINSTSRSNITTRKQSTRTIIKSPWKDVDIPNVTLPELIWSKCSQWSEKTAIECGLTGKSYSYEELRLFSKRVATSLLKSGFRKGDTVTMIVPNSPEFPVSFLGILEAGLTLSAINPIYCAEEIVQQMTDSGSRVMIVHYNMLQTALEVKARFNNQVEIICIHDFDGTARELPSGIRPFSDLIKSGIDISSLEKLAHPIDIDNTTAFLPYSSGTTGLPKGVCLTHKNLVANLIQLSQPEITVLEETTKNHQDSVIGVLPFFHIYGTQVIMTRSLKEGCKVVTLPKFEPKDFLKVLSNNKDIVMYAVPPIILFLGSHPSVTKQHLQNLRFTGTGGAPCGSSDIKRFLEKKDHKIVQAYGMTESSPVLTHTNPDSKNKATVGPPVCNTYVKVVDMNSNKDLQIGETGELCFKGPQVMKCYHNKPEATADTVDKEGWLHTGDIGYIDDEGQCYIVDRKKELIKVKGFQVPPAELESVLRQHPGLCDAGVTSKPCSKSGEVPIAFVVSKPGHPPPESKDIQQFVASKVAPYKQISQVIFVEAIPKNASGKILRRQLKELVQTELKQN